MADFRRVVTALAVLALLSGFAVTASAQQPTAFSCTASAAVPPLLRAEGLTELTGDIVLNCSGGNEPASGANQFIGTVPNTGLANFTVFLGNTTVTSRILNTSDNSSEALLLIDEPGSSTGLALSLASNPLIGCGGTCTVGGANPNAFRGIVSGNSVTFVGIPIVPPGTSTGGVYNPGSRIFRITNVRANASTVGAGPGGTPGQVQAFVSISGSTSVPLNNPTQIVGFVQTGLVFNVRKIGDFTSNVGSSQTNFAQCSTSVNDNFKKNPKSILQFEEGFASAFKTQVVRDPGTGLPAQGVPGAVYNTESGLVISTVTSTSAVGTAATLGLADFGTRLRATFANIPTGVTIWVSTTNITNAATLGVVNVAPYAVLTASETGPFVAVPASDQFQDADTSLNGVAKIANIPVAPVTLTSGAGVAVWEVLAASPLAKDDYNFAVYFTFKANPGANTPAAGVTGTVAGSLAPAPPAFSATDGAKASATLPIPRFIDSGTPKTLVLITVCRTNLLFPFVTNQAGFDTGMAIANTSKDIFDTTPQSGTCTLNFFGANAPSAVTSPVVNGGDVYTALASTSAPNFQGYVIAQCNFQFGHGFAFVSDLGARNLAMGYLALVMEQPGTYRPSGTGEGLTQ